MTAGFAWVTPTGPAFRVGRFPDPWAWPDWAYATGATFGNRWDDPRGQYRVLYASSQRVGAFVETLARFRADLTVVAGLAEIAGEDDGPPPGVVPARWLAGRRVGEAELSGRFVDVGDARSLATLRTAAAAAAIHHGLAEIDAATIRLTAPRGFTQEISRLVYASPSDEGAFAGICYQSRLGDQFVNWAIFEPPEDASPLVAGEDEPIDPEDPDFRAALELLDAGADIHGESRRAEMTSLFHSELLPVLDACGTIDSLRMSDAGERMRKRSLTSRAALGLLSSEC